MRVNNVSLSEESRYKYSIFNEDIRKKMINNEKEKEIIKEN